MAKRGYFTFVRNFNKVVQMGKRPKRAELKFDTDITIGKGFAKIISDIDTFCIQIMREFLGENVARHIDRVYRTLGTAKYGKKVVASGSKTRTETMDATAYNRGYEDLVTRVKEMQIIKSGGRVKGRLGPNVTALKSTDYTAHGGQTKLDTWFFAVEFGTGTGTRVGGDKWVRGPGQAPVWLGRDGKTLKEQDGSWWFGPRRGQGAHIMGQRGFGAFWEYGTRRPRSLWLKVFQEEFPTFFNTRIREISALG